MLIRIAAHATSVWFLTKRQFWVNWPLMFSVYVSGLHGQDNVCICAYMGCSSCHICLILYKKTILSKLVRNVTGLHSIDIICICALQGFSSSYFIFILDIIVHINFKPFWSHMLSKCLWGAAQILTMSALTVKLKSFWLYICIYILKHGLGTAFI